MFGAPLVPAVRFQSIDEKNRADHFYITEGDECLFLYEYTSGMGYAHSETNSLISNLKKKKGAGGYAWKGRAIASCAAVLGPAINPKWLADAVLVPIPPSKIKADPMYDDRMTQVCKAIKSEAPVDVRELIVQVKSTDAVHEGNRLKPDEIEANYAIDENLCGEGCPKYIGIVDDMLTAGAHFKAAKNILSKRFPKSRISGLFIARRIFSDPFGEVSLDDLLA
jgi:formylmethanofuran dehydrogenase subunit D